jgi:hypothetical protein
MFPAAFRLIVVLLHSPAVLAGGAAERSWHIGNDPSTGLSAQSTQQLIFYRNGIDLRMAKARFDWDSCPSVDDNGCPVEWGGTWTTSFDISLWPQIGCLASPCVITNVY